LIYAKKKRRRKSHAWAPLIGNIFGGSQDGELALAGFQKLSAQLREICYSIGAKDLNSPVLKNLFGKFNSFLL
jgi:hypothetical protein